MSQGTNSMIKRGEAKAVFDIEDILCEYGVEVVAEAPSPIRQCDTSTMSSEQAMLYNILLKGEKNVDELCLITGFGIAELNILLL